MNHRSEQCRYLNVWLSRSVRFEKKDTSITVGPKENGIKHHNSLLKIVDDLKKRNLLRSHFCLWNPMSVKGNEHRLEESLDNHSFYYSPKAFYEFQVVRSVVYVTREAIVCHPSIILPLDSKAVDTDDFENSLGTILRVADDLVIGFPKHIVKDPGNMIGMPPMPLLVVDYGINPKSQPGLKNEKYIRLLVAIDAVISQNNLPFGREYAIKNNNNLPLVEIRTLYDSCSSFLDLRPIFEIAHGPDEDYIDKISRVVLLNPEQAARISAILRPPNDYLISIIKPIEKRIEDIFSKMKVETVIKVGE